ncbi:hydrogenase formation protein HypD [Candidatus Bathyarchaeota archaeon]|nr:MAG: hydrogenase formation protein HypD [Candidatus Hecatellales archaeon]RLI35793.1 MAG: hydrogenase formation protein HypD [Candidatus Bathyarchaeota archaeon]
MFQFRDRHLAEKILEAIRRLNLGKVRFMHVCGTHQDTLVRFGLDELLRRVNVEVRQGPGCPVCVTTDREYVEAAVLARKGVTLATFGDASRVPCGGGKSLLDLRAEGCDVRVVYSVEDALKLAERGLETVFLAVGFETTAPSTAAVLLSNPPENFTILNCHRYIPPAIEALLQMGEVKLNGLIEPGHVSTIIGVKPYLPISRRFRIPQVIAGFEPLDLLMAVYMLCRQLAEGKAEVENEYTRSVRFEGNPKALEAMDRVFEACNVEWRGFPLIPSSGMKLRREYEKYDARLKYEDWLEELPPYVSPEKEGCRCGEILRGVADPWDCPLFGKACTPRRPIGPCMVSIEGLCNIEYKYRFRQL